MLLIRKIVVTTNWDKIPNGSTRIQRSRFFMSLSFVLKQSTELSFGSAIGGKLVVHLTSKRCRSAGITSFFVVS